MKKSTASTEGTARRLANLRPPFKKGQSGNPAGRKKGSVTLPERIKRILEGTDKLPAAIVKTIKTAVGEDKQALDAILIVGLLNSLQGDDKWAKLLLEHGYGKPEQTSKLIGDPDAPLEILQAVDLTDEQLAQIAAIANGSSDA